TPIFALYALRTALYATALSALRDVAARLTIAGRRDRRVRGVHADTARGTRQLTVRDGRRPVTRTRNNRRHTNTGRVLEVVLGHEHRRGRVVRRIGEEGLF